VIIGNLDISFKAVNQRMEDGTYDPMVEIKVNELACSVPLSRIGDLLNEATEAMRIASRGEGETREN
jgi:hypothetical protein